MKGCQTVNQIAMIDSPATYHTNRKRALYMHTVCLSYVTTMCKNNVQRSFLLLIECAYIYGIYQASSKRQKIHNQKYKKTVPWCFQNNTLHPH